MTSTTNFEETCGPATPGGVHARDQPVLSVRGLTVEFKTAHGWSTAVNNVDLDIGSDEIFGLVGESGSGKSVTALSLLGLLPPRSSRLNPKSSIKLSGTELAGLGNRSLDRIRGARVGMIFQEPMSSLNPAYTIGDQIGEAVRRHRRTGRKASRARAVEMLELVGIPNATRNVDQYPHHFSGGMRQRAMIAMALACEPELLIADEPTTALDVTVQATILDLLAELQRSRQMSVLLITHDLSVIGEVADRVGVMYAGELVEMGGTEPLFATPAHPYTSGLLGSVLRLDDDSPLTAIPGSVPAIGEELAGCRFAPRCVHRQSECVEMPIPLVEAGSQQSRCIRTLELSLTGLPE
ncbi:ABC transporter ATP-binding protein [uncultured Serinicoccus sp.]|uniref:ABC transporter ATP-binding protein n=1 Tax=uncultured Serinicoccus sp. TaxID=735514 RepID=UPI002635B2A8|nr:ABC transporter ATP-binding protein [uncultured Serinicoccus sp.]